MKGTGTRIYRTESGHRDRLEITIMFPNIIEIRPQHSFVSKAEKGK